MGGKQWTAKRVLDNETEKLNVNLSINRLDMKKKYVAIKNFNLINIQK
jgi:hypothetical protein